MKSKKILMMFAGCLAVMSLVVTGCPGSESCSGWDCSGHGTCEMQGGSPVCVCDDGYRISDSNPAVCEAELARMGEPCTASEGCLDGWCLKFGSDETGYCSKRECQGNDSCVNYANDGEMCCVDLGGEYFICMKIDEGYSCGDGTGMCGADCTGQGDSACHASQACLSGGTSGVCAHECSTDTDCADCAVVDNPDALFRCTPISGGATYCLEDDEERCFSSQECEAGEACFPNPTSDGLDIQGACGNLGDLPAGADCDEDADPNSLPPDQRCAGFYCMDDHCVEVCSLETDCPENMICGNMGFCMDDLCNVVANIGLCQWWAGSGDLCGGDADCPAHEVCDFYLDHNEAVIKSCKEESCDLLTDENCSDIGGPCGDDIHTCYNGFCLTGGGDSYCGAACETDADCPDTGDPTFGYECGLIGLGDDNSTGSCLEAFFGTGEAGDPCPFGNVNADAEDCLQGSSCLGNDDAGTCTTDQDCIDSLGADMNPQCVSGTCGFSLCSPKCDADGNCDPGLLPEIIGGGSCYCFPEGPTGSSEFGDACIFGDVNADSDLCASGLACLGNDDSGDCTTDEDCSDLGPEMNPDCVAGTCGFSFCAAACDAQGGCSDYTNATAIELSDGSCYCVPAGPVGTQDAGEACIFGDIHADTDYCMADMACLGIDGATNPVDCSTNGDQDCIDTLGAEINPYCNADSVCVASFCAPACGVGDTCDEGFVDIDVGGSCYCQPGEPAPTGDQDAGEPCIFGDIHADTDHCMADMACLGIDGTSSPVDCSANGDADCLDETNGLGAAVNPYCSDNVCVASFCAAYCAADDTCTDGTATDISGTCFCIL